MLKPWQEEDLLRIVTECVSRELPSGSPCPAAEEDFVKSDAVDSMAWVGILTGIEQATGLRNFGNPWPEDRPRSIRSLAEAVRQAYSTLTVHDAPAAQSDKSNVASRPIYLAGWGIAFGALKIPASQIELECGVPAGTMAERAAIHTVCRAPEAANEVILAHQAGISALEAGDVDAGDLDMLIATSATYLHLPSLPAALHTRMLLREDCPALDVGGACVGLVNAMAVAQGMLQQPGRRTALVVASEVNSRRLGSPQVPGEFRELFGDGACAFVLRAEKVSESNHPALQLGGFVFGCAGSMASSLRLAVEPERQLEVDFKGEALAQGAITTLNQIMARLENLSGVSRTEVSWFAFHEPNPRLAAILAKTANVPIERFTQTAATTGNLGSVTCGVNLCTALDRIRLSQTGGCRTVFVAAVGPGVLWGGTYVRADGSSL